MDNIAARIEAMKNKAGSYWGNRIISQLEYAVKMSKIDGGGYDSLIRDAAGFLEESLEREGVIADQVSQRAEAMLSGISGAAKRYKIICAAHAHIDMNWMWGFAETVAVTLDTFRTMLNLMEEYPGFKFSQSQASVYRIVEEYDPAMLEEIKKRVKEGRWEITASTWVETDKNMPCGESLARHILYTKRYLSELFDIDPGSLNLDFEPDTFGHNMNVPEILTKGGVKYYYHCRGYEEHYAYKWQSPSGNSILVYREPFWYNAEIRPEMVLHVPEFCARHGVDAMLKVYGVGDHGGGPTRRDLERIIDMASWPVFPQIGFGTFSEFFSILEKASSNMPVEKGELNFVFTGCYTTQTRIKAANKIGEAKLNEAEAFGAISALFAKGKYRGELLEKAWERILFNHFHDILPGSGVIDTREYALGEFQKALAAANTEISNALRNIASKVDTSALASYGKDALETVSEGAGVGYAIKDFGIPQTERGKGLTRILHFFNPSPYERREAVEVTVWDWPGNKERIVIKDADGSPVRHQVLQNEIIQYFNTSYWGHEYIRLLVDAVIPPYGYGTYIMSENEKEDIECKLPEIPRIEKPDVYILENNYVKVVFDSRNASILSMTDKTAGKEMIDPKRPAGVFRLVEEDDCKGMTAWIVGRYMNVSLLNENVKIREACTDRSALRQWVKYGVEFKNSKLDVTVSLDCGSSRLDYSVECDWHEIGKKGKYVPQLNFWMPLGYKCASYKYDIPFGVIERTGIDMDVPANGWAVGLPTEKGSKALMIMARTKYGFRCADDSMSLTLIRSSYDPDPYPEFGIHNFKFAVGIVDDTANNSLIKQAYDYNHPASFISGTVHKGGLPLSGSFMSLEAGSVAVSAVKIPEGGTAGTKMIIRVYETDGAKTRAAVKFVSKPVKAWFVDINENALEDGGKISVDGDKVVFDVEAYAVASICVEF